MLTSAAYFAVGQVLLLLSVVLIQVCTRTHCLCHSAVASRAACAQCMTPYDDQKEIESGNTAAGVKLFGTLTSVGVRTCFQECAITVRVSHGRGCLCQSFHTPSSPLIRWRPFSHATAWAWCCSRCCDFSWTSSSFQATGLWTSRSQRTRTGGCGGARPVPTLWRHRCFCCCVYRGVAAIEAAIVLAIAFALGSLVPDIECYNFT